jgi:hypothetical protein
MDNWMTTHIENSEQVEHVVSQRFPGLPDASRPEMWVLIWPQI